MGEKLLRTNKWDKLMEKNCGLREFCFLTVKWRKGLERASVHALLTMFGVSQLNELLRLLYWERGSIRKLSNQFSAPA